MLFPLGRPEAAGVQRLISTRRRHIAHAYARLRTLMRLAPAESFWSRRPRARYFGKGAVKLGVQSNFILRCASFAKSAACAHPPPPPTSPASLHPTPTIVTTNFHVTFPVNHRAVPRTPSSQTPPSSTPPPPPPPPTTGFQPLDVKKQYFSASLRSLACPAPRRRTACRDDAP